MRAETAELDETETTDVPDQGEPDEQQLEDDPDEQTEPETKTEPEPEPAAAPEGHTLEWWEEASTKADKENDRHTKRVIEIYGDESEAFEQCPMCVGGPAGWLTITQFSDEHLALIRARLGMEDPSTLAPMRGAVVCDTCAGRGKVKTPSLVPGYQTLMCPDCVQADSSGRKFATGWKYVAGPLDQQRPEFATVPVTPTEIVGGQAAGAGAEQGTSVIEQPPYDAWSRPLGHPHYNIPPADVGV